jgi:hypothetical protein
MPEVQHEGKGVGLHPGVFPQGGIENKPLPTVYSRKLLSNCESQASRRDLRISRYSIEKGI